MNTTSSSPSYIPPSLHHPHHLFTITHHQFTIPPSLYPHITSPSPPSLHHPPHHHFTTLTITSPSHHHFTPTLRHHPHHHFTIPPSLYPHITSPSSPSLHHPTITSPSPPSLHHPHHCNDQHAQVNIIYLTQSLPVAFGLTC